LSRQTSALLGGSPWSEQSSAAAATAVVNAGMTTERPQKNDDSSRAMHGKNQTQRLSCCSGLGGLVKSLE
jgi:hypothetical protein